jgi:hypothetical protein
MRSHLPFALGAIALLALAGCFGSAPSSSSTPSTTPPPPPPTANIPLAFGTPVDLKAIGYEPSIACDSTGAMFITAHKDLNRPDTWPYAASWLLVSTDRGATWGAPALAASPYKAFVGDEGDLAIDARDWLYYADTFLADDWLHVWSNHATTWQYSVPLKSTQADDRPWIFAQGPGIVHYLGNNGVTIPGERYIYYRSTNGGLTFSPGMGLPFAGWAHGAAQVNGTYAYLVQEVTPNGASAMDVMASSDSGATWGKPVDAGQRNGTAGDGAYPLISVDAAGNPSVVWVSVEGAKGSRLTFSQSADHGVTWSATDITPGPGYYDHVTVASAGNGTVAVAYYATNDTVPGANSQWHLYAGMAHGRVTSTKDFDFKMADPQVLYTGGNLHALHDFFEICIDDQGALDVSYMTNLPTPPTAPNATDGDRHLWFVRATPPLAL